MTRHQTRHELYSKLEIALALLNWAHIGSSDLQEDVEIRNDIIDAYAQVYGCSHEQAIYDLVCALRQAHNGIVVHGRNGELLDEMSPREAVVIVISVLTNVLYDALEGDDDATTASI